MNTATHTPTPNVFDAFYANKTPANAVALAIADHRAHNGGRGSFEFTDALSKAETQLRAHDDLVAALRALHDSAMGIQGSKPIVRACAEASAALARAGA